MDNKVQENDTGTMKPQRHPLSY